MFKVAEYTYYNYTLSCIISRAHDVLLVLFKQSRTFIFPFSKLIDFARFGPIFTKINIELIRDLCLILIFLHHC